MDVKLVLLFLSSAVLALSSANITNNVSPEPRPEVTELDKNDIQSDYFDGIDLNTLNEDETEELMNAEDEIMKGELDIYVYKNSLVSKSRRPKRMIPLIARGLFTVGRALFRQFAKGRITRSGSRLTRQYTRRGSFRDANRDFDRLNLTGVRNIRNGNLRGRTGMLGRHRFTVRNTSSNGSPTLEIRSPGSGRGSIVRKFRYQKKIEK